MNESGSQTIWFGYSLPVLQSAKPGHSLSRHIYNLLVSLGPGEVNLKIPQINLDSEKNLNELLKKHLTLI
jgi:hypothetical protein